MMEQGVFKITTFCHLKKVHQWKRYEAIINKQCKCSMKNCDVQISIKKGERGTTISKLIRDCTKVYSLKKNSIN